MSSDMLNQTWSDSHYRDGWICSWVIGLRCCKSRVLTVGPWQSVHSPLRVCTWLTCHLHWIPLTHLLLLDCSLQWDRQGEWEEAKKERKRKKDKMTFWHKEPQPSHLLMNCIHLHQLCMKTGLARTQYTLRASIYKCFLYKHPTIMHEKHGWSNQGVKVWGLSMTLLADPAITRNEKCLSPLMAIQNRGTIYPLIHWHVLDGISELPKMSRFMLCFPSDVLSTVLIYYMNAFLHCFDCSL